MRIYYPKMQKYYLKMQKEYKVQTVSFINILIVNIVTKVGIFNQIREIFRNLPPDFYHKSLHD